MKSESLSLLKTSEPVKAGAGIASPLPLPYTFYKIPRMIYSLWINSLFAGLRFHFRNVDHKKTWFYEETEWNYVYSNSLYFRFTRIWLRIEY